MYATVYEPTRAELLRNQFRDKGYDVLANGMPFISEIPEVQAHYEHCRLEGTSHILAEMFAWQQPPACMTDDVFNQGWGASADQFGKGHEWIGNMLAEEARSAGVDITGARYLHGLAAYPGDPKAWVRSRGDVQRVCEERGWGCQGAVNVKAREPLHPKQNISVADDIVEEQTLKAIESDPGLAERALRDGVGEIRHEIKEKLTPHWHKKAPRKSRSRIALERNAA